MSSLNNSPLREYEVNPLIVNILPYYFSSLLFQKDLLICSFQLEIILSDKSFSSSSLSSSPSPSSSPLPPLHPSFSLPSSTWRKEYFDSYLPWFKSLLSHELLLLVKLSNHLLRNIYLFIDFNLKMILISLKQSKNRFQQSDQEISTICLQLIRLGYQHHHFISFGIALFRSLPVILGEDYITSSSQNSWKNVYSSILALCLPLCLTSTTTGENQIITASDSNNNNNILVETEQFSEEIPPPVSHMTMYATAHNSINL